MKKILNLLLVFTTILIPISFIHAEGESDKRTIASKNPVKLVDQVADESKIQYTELDGVSHWGGRLDSEYTIANTFDSAKSSVGDYLQYVMYIGLVVATIFLIRNAFKLVTSSNREKQMETFKRNLLYIVIGVVLLTGFYYILGLFSGMINVVFDF